MVDKYFNIQIDKSVYTKNKFFYTKDHCISLINRNLKKNKDYIIIDSKYYISKKSLLKLKIILDNNY